VEFKASANPNSSASNRRRKTSPVRAGTQMNAATESRRGEGGTARVRAEPRAPLTRESIVLEALELMDAEGVEGFSLRKLGARLGVSAPAIYRHFADKDDLCRSVVEYVSQGMRVEIDRTAPPSEQIKALMRAMREHWSRHPSLVELETLYFSPLGGQPTAIALDLIRALGAKNRIDAMRWLRAMVWTTLGFTLVQHRLARSVHHTLVDPLSLVYDVRVVAAPAGMPVNAGRLDVDELFESVIDAFVTGMARQEQGRARRPSESEGLD
jgi:AcrR family transcriptional regulator